MERRSFVQRILLGVPSILGLGHLLSACGRQDVVDLTGYLGLSCDASNTTATFATNHTLAHSLTVPREDIEAGVEKAYSIRGASTHNHNVTVTAAQFQTLRAGAQVVVTSTTGNGHTHQVTLVCT